MGNKLELLTFSEALRGTTLHVPFEGLRTNETAKLAMKHVENLDSSLSSLCSYCSPMGTLRVKVIDGISKEI